MNRLILGGLTLIPTMVCSSANAAESDKSMNVLFIMVDDLRPELGCYGVDAIKTPNIDRLAERGVTFDNAYCNIPVSGASRASLLTGLYSHYPERFSHYAAYAQKDAPEAMPVSGWFTKNGYHTVSNGKIFHHIDDFEKSWSELPWRSERDGYGSDWSDYNVWNIWQNPESANKVNAKTGRGPYCEVSVVADSSLTDGKTLARTLDDIERLSKIGKPFFLACGFIRPHLPFVAPKKYWDMYDRDSIPMASNYFRSEGLPKRVANPGEMFLYGGVDQKSEEGRREIKHGYYASVSYTDALVGQLLDELERNNLYDNTIIVLLGDHGWSLGEHTLWGKHTIMRNATNCPLIISAPNLSKGSRSSSLVEYVDIYPTLCDLCDIPLPKEHIDGTSIKPILEKPKSEVNDYAFIQWAGGDNLVSERYSYTEWRKDGKIVDRLLFDHKIDPMENKNVAFDKKYKKIVDKFSAKIAEIVNRPF